MLEVRNTSDLTPRCSAICNQNVELANALVNGGAGVPFCRESSTDVRTLRSLFCAWWSYECTSVHTIYDVCFGAFRRLAERRLMTAHNVLPTYVRICVRLFAHASRRSSSLFVVPCLATSFVDAFAR